MSNETRNVNHVDNLRKARSIIQDASTVDNLHGAIAELYTLLREMERSSTGEIEQTVLRTIEEINRFWMHDATRDEVCKWVQTLICELNT